MSGKRAPIEPGLCRHFGNCGGCTLQDMPDAAYSDAKRGAVVVALARHGLEAAEVGPLVEIGPGTRRRAVFKAAKTGGAAVLGFHARATHAIVDMRECRVLTPALFALVGSMRALMAPLLSEGEQAELAVTETAAGPDIAIHMARKPTPAARAHLAQWAERVGAARITLNDGIAVALATPCVTFGRARVAIPPGSFLQATLAGEKALQDAVCAGVGRAKSVADLFAGCGTFALVLAEKARVHAVETDRAALDALAAGARGAERLKPVTTERRDLFKVPLGPAELKRFDAVVLDPPRAGAQAQVQELVKSDLGRVVYASCNPESFARDARLLVDGGFRMGTVMPVDQFAWSSHIELVAAFSRR
jgi:23S rRNA (uracil1939-C5)-methyltransferase